MNENERNAILEYEQILQGKSSRTKLSTTYFRADSNEQNHKTAVHILRYIFTKIYKWTPLDVMNKASKQMISDLKITIPYSKLIFPKEMNPKRDYFYLAKILFPEEIKSFGKYDRVLYLYNQVRQRKAQFPEGYFSEPGQGEYRAGICLHQAITDSQQFRNEDELYEFFSDESKAHAFLKKYKLDNVCRITFRTPLDYLYAALPDGQDNGLKCILIPEQYTRSDNYRKEFFKAQKPVNNALYRCAYCGKKFTFQQIQVDHIFPVNELSYSGIVRKRAASYGIANANDVKNLCCACKKCNLKKGTKLGMWVIRGFLGKHEAYWKVRHIAKAIVFWLCIIFAISFLKENAPEFFQTLTKLFLYPFA